MQIGELSASLWKHDKLNPEKWAQTWDAPKKITPFVTPRQIPTTCHLHVLSLLQLVFTKETSIRVLMSQILRKVFWKLPTYLELFIILEYNTPYKLAPHSPLKHPFSIKITLKVILSMSGKGYFGGWSLLGLIYLQIKHRSFTVSRVWNWKMEVNS